MENLFLRTVTSECPSVDPDAHTYRTNITAVPHDTKGDGNACHPVSYSYDTTDTKAHCGDPRYNVGTKSYVVFRWLWLFTLRQRTTQVHIHSTERLF